MSLKILSLLSDEFLQNIPKWNETRFSGDRYDARNYNNNLFVDIMSFYLTGEAVGLANWSEFLPTITKNIIIETFDFLGADAGDSYLTIIQLLRCRNDFVNYSL